MAIRNDQESGRYLSNLSEKCQNNSLIDPELFIQHKVNKGLRDQKGKGVVTGLTNISDVIAKKVVDG